MSCASPCTWLVMNKKTKPNCCWKGVLAEVYPQHCRDNNNQTSELTTTHQNWGDTNFCERYDRVWVNYYKKKINQKYPTHVKVAVVKKANSCSWGREPPVGMHTALYLICSVNHSLHFFGICSRWKLLSPVTLCEEASETSRIYLLDMTVCYSNSKNNPQRLSTFTADYMRPAQSRKVCYIFYF